MKKPSDVFKQIRFAKGEKRGKPHLSTDDEEHGAVGEVEWNQQLAHQKKRAMQEDLRQWFDKDHPEGGWKRINSKGEAVGPCAREPGEPKPKCMSNEKRAQLSKKERASAVAAKRKHDPNPERKGEPINVSNFGKGKISEDMENLEEKNVPTSPEKWAQAKSQAKAKFDVYPSAYANGWAAKKYKEMGGGWKSVSEAVKDKFDIGEYDQEGDMAKSDLRSIIANAQKMHDMLEDADNLPEWVQSKITKAEDYISTVANYMTAEMNEESELQESGGPVLYKKGDDHIEQYGKDSFALYKDGKKAKYYTTIEAAKEAMNESPAVIKTNKEIGSKVTSIGPGGKETVIKTDSAYAKYRKMGSSSANARARAAGEKNSHMFESEVVVEEDIKSARIIKALYKKKGVMKEENNLEEGMMKRMATDKEEDKLSAVPFDKPYTTVKKIVTDKSGAKHSPMSRARDLARKGTRAASIVREAADRAKKKKKEETKKSDDTFQPEPELSSQIIRND